MKLKPILLLFFAIFFMGCSSNEIEEIEEIESQEEFNIVGKWYYYSIVENGIKTLYNDCLSKSYFQLNADGSGMYYSYTMSNGVCELRDENLARWRFEDNEYIIETTLSSSWVSTNNNPYSAVVIYKYPVTINQDNDIQFVGFSRVITLKKQK
ncbi:lipocalin family protein [Tenacibaculum sp. nBUS_03]|uniref:lipocalin family protein n=1 Tax=Tenacibaculum sp. nBUS_03 TaxID=3395320 RepID=UPI003EBD3B09